MTTGTQIQNSNYSNNVTAQLVRDGNIGGILSRRTGAGDTFYGYDGNGNVTLLTNSAGVDVGHYRYDAFGNTLEAVGPRAGENPYRFSTKELHGPSGLYDYGLRFYSPGMGRWMNRDPLEEAGGVNLYGFVDNNPINDVDEYGLEPAKEHPCMHDGIPNSCGPGQGKDPYVRVWQDDYIDRGKELVKRSVNGLATVAAIVGLGAMAGKSSNTSNAAKVAAAKAAARSAAEKEIRTLAGQLRFTKTTAAHMANPGRYVPRHILANAIKYGKRMPDPQGAKGAIKIVTQMTKNEKNLNLEIIYRKSDKTILHFLYRTKPFE